MRLVVQFRQTDQRLNMDFKERSCRFDAAFQNFQQVTAAADVEHYDGDYDVTPQAKAQTLATKDKFMADDVRVKAIPYFEVSNNSGGKTVYIGTLDDYLDEEKAVLGKSRLGTMRLGSSSREKYGAG